MNKNDRTLYQKKMLAKSLVSSKMKDAIYHINDDLMVKTNFNTAGREVNSEISLDVICESCLTPQQRFETLTRRLILKKPREFATLLIYADESPIYYLHAHGQNKNDNWFYCSSYHLDFPRIPVQARLNNLNVGSAVVEVCNRGKYVADAKIPLIYPKGDISLETTNKMKLFLPKGMKRASPEKAVRVICNYLEDLFEDAKANAKNNSSEFLANARYKLDIKLFESFVKPALLG